MVRSQGLQLFKKTAQMVLSFAQAGQNLTPGARPLLGQAMLGNQDHEPTVLAEPEGVKAAVKGPFIYGQFTTMLAQENT